MVTITRPRSKTPRKASKKLLWEFQVSLIVRGFDEDPAEITSVLGSRPSKVWRKGDLIDPRATIRWDDNGWELAVGSLSSRALTKHVEKLLSRAAPSRARLSRLPGKASVSVFCGVMDYERGVDLSLSKQAIEGIAKIGAELIIDYYDLSDHSD